MLLDSQLVPETIVKPGSFVGLMALYESNYLRLLQLVPELERLDGCFRSRVAGECELFVEILERCRYTITMSLTYHFETDDGRLADPDIKVRAYLDGRLAEAEQAVRDLRFAVKPIRTRRTRPDRYGPRADPRATLREARRRAGHLNGRSCRRAHR